MKKALATAARRTNRRPPITLFRRTWPRFLAACAKGRAACRADLYAGTNAFGACEYVEAAARRRGEDRRCVYATVLRNPIDRVESSWRYFCLNGAERRKGWTNAMKRAGSCSYSLERWAQTQSMLSVLELSTNQAPVARDAPVNQSLRCAPLADGPAAVRRRPRAYLEAALANVVGPDAPVRAVVVEDLADGLRLLARELDLPLSATPLERRERGAGARWRRRASRGGGRTRARGRSTTRARDAGGERRPWGLTRRRRPT